MATSSLTNFSFNFIGKEPDLLKRLSTPHPSHQSSDSQQWEHPVSVPFSDDGRRLGDDKPLTSRPTLFQALSRGDRDYENDMLLMDMSGTEEHPPGARNSNSLSNPRNSSGSPALSLSTPHTPQAPTSGPIVPPSSSAGTEGYESSLTLQYPLSGSRSLTQVNPPDDSLPISQHQTLSGPVSSSTSSHPPHAQLFPPQPTQSDAITRFKSFYAILLSSVDSLASDVEPNTSGQNVNGLAGSASLSLSTTLSKVLSDTTQAQIFAESSIRSAEESLKAAHASHHSAEASFKTASDVKALVGEVVDVVRRRDHELKTTIDQLGVWIEQTERHTQNSRIMSTSEDVEMEGAAQEVMNGYRSEEDETQVRAREEKHLQQLREQEALAKQKLSEAEKNIAEVRILRERMKLEKEEVERKRQEVEAEERERQLRLAEERKRKRQIAEEEQAARQRRIVELQQKLAEERAKQAEEAEKKRLGEERMRKEEEEEAERHRQRNQEMERQRQQQERQAAEEQAKKDAELRRIAEERTATKAERHRVVEEKRMKVEEANRQHKIEQDRLKASQEADLRVKETKEREIEEERKLRETLKLRKSKSRELLPQLEPQVQEHVRRESVQDQKALVGARPVVEVKIERAKSAQVTSASPVEGSQSTHPSIAAIKASASMSPTVPFAPSSSKSRSQSSLAPSLPNKPLSFNPVSRQTLVPTNTDNKPTKAEKERLKRERLITSAGGDHPGARAPTQEETRAISLGLRAPHLIPNPAAASLPKRPDAQAVPNQVNKSRPKQSLRVHTHTNIDSSQADSLKQPDSSSSTSSDAPSIHSYDITNTGNLVIKSEYSPVLPDVQSLNIRHIVGARTDQETSFSGTISRPVEVLPAIKPPPPPVQTATRKAEVVQHHSPVMEHLPQPFRYRAGENSRPASPVNTQPTRNASPTSPHIGDGGWLNVKTHLAQYPVTRQDDASHESRQSYSPSLEDHARTPPLPPSTHALYPSTSSSYRPDDISCNYRSPSPREHIGMTPQTQQTNTKKRKHNDPEDRRRGWAPGARGARTNRHRPHSCDVYMPEPESGIFKRSRIIRDRFRASPQTPSPPPPPPSPPHPLAHHTPSVAPAQIQHHYDAPVSSSLVARFSHPEPHLPDGDGCYNEDHLLNRRIVSHPLPANPRNNAHLQNADSNRGGRTSSAGTVSLLSRLADEATEPSASSSQWPTRQDSNGNGISGKRGGGGGGGKRGNTTSNRNLSQRIASDNVQPRSPALWDRLS